MARRGRVSRVIDAAASCFLAIDGITERRPFDWEESTRLIQRDPTGAALKAWVLAEGELLLSRAVAR